MKIAETTAPAVQPLHDAAYDMEDYCDHGKRRGTRCNPCDAQMRMVAGMPPRQPKTGRLMGAIALLVSVVALAIAL